MTSEAAAVTQHHTAQFFTARSSALFQPQAESLCTSPRLIAPDAVADDLAVDSKFSPGSRGRGRKAGASKAGFSNVAAAIAASDVAFFPPLVVELSGDLPAESDADVSRHPRSPVWSHTTRHAKKESPQIFHPHSARRAAHRQIDSFPVSNCSEVACNEKNSRKGHKEDSTNPEPASALAFPLGNTNAKTCHTTSGAISQKDVIGDADHHGLRTSTSSPNRSPALQAQIVKTSSSAPRCRSTAEHYYLDSAELSSLKRSVYPDGPQTVDDNLNKGTPPSCSREPYRGGRITVRQYDRSARGEHKHAKRSAGSPFINKQGHRIDACTTSGIATSKPFCDQISQNYSGGQARSYEERATMDEVLQRSPDAGAYVAAPPTAHSIGRTYTSPPSLEKVSRSDDLLHGRNRNFGQDGCRPEEARLDGCRPEEARLDSYRQVLKDIAYTPSSRLADHQCSESLEISVAPQTHAEPTMQPTQIRSRIGRPPLENASHNAVRQVVPLIQRGDLFETTATSQHQSEGSDCQFLKIDTSNAALSIASLASTDGTSTDGDTGNCPSFHYGAVHHATSHRLADARHNTCNESPKVHPALPLVSKRRFVDGGLRSGNEIAGSEALVAQDLQKFTNPFVEDEDCLQAAMEPLSRCSSGYNSAGLFGKSKANDEQGAELFLATSTRTHDALRSTSSIDLSVDASPHNTSLIHRQEDALKSGLSHESASTAEQEQASQTQAPKKGRTLGSRFCTNRGGERLSCKSLNTLKESLGTTKAAPASSKRSRRLREFTITKAAEAGRRISSFLRTASAALHTFASFMRCVAARTYFPLELLVGVLLILLITSLSTNSWRINTVPWVLFDTPSNGDESAARWNSSSSLSSVARVGGYLSVEIGLTALSLKFDIESPQGSDSAPESTKISYNDVISACSSLSTELQSLGPSMAEVLDVVPGTPYSELVERFNLFASGHERAMRWKPPLIALEELKASVYGASVNGIRCHHVDELRQAGAICWGAAVMAGCVLGLAILISCCSLEPVVPWHNVHKRRTRAVTPPAASSELRRLHSKAIVPSHRNPFERHKSPSILDSHNKSSPVASIASQHNNGARSPIRVDVGCVAVDSSPRKRPPSSLLCKCLHSSTALIERNPLCIASLILTLHSLCAIMFGVGLIIWYIMTNSSACVGPGGRSSELTAGHSGTEAPHESMLYGGEVCNSGWGSVLGTVVVGGFLACIGYEWKTGAAHQRQHELRRRRSNAGSDVASRSPNKIMTAASEYDIALSKSEYGDLRPESQPPRQGRNIGAFMEYEEDGVLGAGPRIVKH